MGKTFGGFIGQEAISEEANGEHHNTTLVFNTARACLRYTILCRHIKKVYLPYYICDSVVDAMSDENTEYFFYGINDSLEIDTQIPELASHEVLLYVNYFGLKDHYIAELQNIHGKNLLIDNSQAFFQKSYQYSWSFNSARKFFGVTDGAYLYAPDYDNSTEQTWPMAQYDNTYLTQRTYGSQKMAYQGFVEHERHLSTQIKSISHHSHNTLKNTDYKKCALTRRQNFLYLHKNLSPFNQLKIESLSDKSVPLYYPFLCEVGIRNRLIEQGLFIPCLWQEVKHRSTTQFAWEKYLSSNLLALPIDQRYNIDDMKTILKILHDHL